MVGDHPVDTCASEPSRDARVLIQSAVEGEAQAIERLLVAYLPALQGFLKRHAGRLVAGKESSSDLVQSVCREALEGLAEERLEYRGEAEFKQWLYQAALLKLMKRRRHFAAGKRDAGLERPLGTQSNPGDGALAGREATPSRIVMREEDAERLRAVMPRLPPRFEEVLRLAYFEGLGNAEVAARMGLEPGHARVLLSRARARLATLLSPAGSQEREA